MPGLLSVFAQTAAQAPAEPTDYVYWIVQGVIWLLLAGLVVTAAVALWTNPGYFLLGGVCGAVATGLAWAILGTMVISILGYATEEREFARSVNPAWPIFIAILIRMSILGLLGGGIAGSFLLGDLPSERRQKRQAEREKSAKNSAQK